MLHPGGLITLILPINLASSFWIKQSSQHMLETFDSFCSGILVSGNKPLALQLGQASLKRDTLVRQVEQPLSFIAGACSLDDIAILDQC